MKLTGIAWRGYVLPLRHEYVTSQGRATGRRGLIVFLKADDGTVGIGEASPVGTPTADEVTAVGKVLERLAPMLVAEDVSTLAGALSDWAMPGELRFGLETALLDMLGKSRGRPLAVLLGGTPRAVSVNAVVAAESATRAAKEARSAAEAGFGSLKLKVGCESLEEDEAIVAAVRQVVGAAVKLRLDPNQAWAPRTAVESIRRLSRYEIEYVEQPVSANDIAGLAAVRRAVSVPVAADESLGSMKDLQDILGSDAADIFIIKAARLGGLTSALGIAKAGLAAGRSVVVTTSLESGVGIAAAAHLAAALPVESYAHGLSTGLLFWEDLASGLPLPRDGVLAVPDRPGLGLTVEADAVRKYGLGISGSFGVPFEL